ADGTDNDTIYSAGAGMALSGTTFAIAPGGVATTNLADGSVTAAKVASGQVVKSLNGLKDDVSLAVGANLTLATNGSTLQLSANGSANAWSLSGNGLVGGEFLGSTNSVGFFLKVNNVVGLRLLPTADTPNWIGGIGGNDASPLAVGATIAGGGSANYEGSPAFNIVDNNYGTVGGGIDNEAGGIFSTVSGGLRNKIYPNGEAS